MIEIKKNQKVPVELHDNNVPDSPLVSVIVQTYQHANYIAKCIEGILMQKTDFPFEVLVGEDASTDGTRDICIKYAQQHPDKIKLFLHSRENVIYRNNNPTGRFNFLWNLNNSNGKYIAMCEGDDYWTDPYKLQKQVDFLEANTDYSLTAHRHHTIKDNKIIKTSAPVISCKLTLKDLITEMPFSTASVMIRHKDLDIKSDIFGSHFLFMQIASKGFVNFSNDIMSCYRIHSGGIWSCVSIDKKYNMEISSINNRINYFQSNSECCNLLKDFYVKTSLSYMIKFLIKPNISRFTNVFISSFKYGLRKTHFTTFGSNLRLISILIKRKILSTS